MREQRKEGSFSVGGPGLWERLSPGQTHNLLQSVSAPPHPLSLSHPQMEKQRREAPFGGDQAIFSGAQQSLRGVKRPNAMLGVLPCLISCSPQK